MTAPVKGLRSVAFHTVEALGRMSLVTTRSAEGDVGLLGRFRVRAPVADCRRCGGFSGNHGLIRGLRRKLSVTIVASTNAPKVSSPKRRLIGVYCRAKVQMASIPKPTTYIATLAVSKLPAEEFTFRTFLPASGGRQRRILGRVTTRAEAVMVCRTPRHLMGALGLLSRHLKSQGMAIYERLAGERRATFRSALRKTMTCCRTGSPGKRYIVMVTKEDQRRVHRRRGTH